MAIRRIEREITNTWTNINETTMNSKAIFIERDKLEVTFLAMFNEDVVKIMLYFPNSYPFKPPRVMISNYLNQHQYNYLDLININGEWLRHFGLVECVCCNSILCKWGVRSNMKDIIEEVTKILSIKKRIIEIMCCRQMIKQKIGHYIPVEEFL